MDGSNLSERAFSGRQAETLIVFDDDEMAWTHYASQYEAVRDASTSRLPVTDGPPPVEKVRIERTPALVEAEESPNGTTLYVPALDAEESGIPHPTLITRMEAIRPAIRRGMAGVTRAEGDSANGFALSMNADARSFKAEIVKRCLMIYTRTALPGDDTVARRRLQQSVAAIRDRINTALYRHYLTQILPRLDVEVAGSSDASEGTDALLLSSTTLCEIFADHMPASTPLPAWCQPMTLAEYQKRAFERPRRVLDSLLGEERYSVERRPPEQCWTVTGDRITVAVAPIEFARMRADIPDWLLDDTASASGQIALNRKLTEEFLNRPVRAPRRWAWWRSWRG